MQRGYRSTLRVSSRGRRRSLDILEAPKMEIAENEKPDVPLLRES